MNYFIWSLILIGVIVIIKDLFKFAVGKTGKKKEETKEEIMKSLLRQNKNLKEFITEDVNFQEELINKIYDLERKLKKTNAKASEMELQLLNYKRWL